MNPLASTTYTGRVFIALAAILSIVFAAGCGSGSGFIPPNQVGFNNGSLNGTYVFSSSGVDANGFLFTVAGSIVANGSGGITGGTVDVVGADFNPSSLPVTGSYNVITDGRGQFNVKSSAGTLNFAFVLSSNTHGLVSEFDNTATGSGTIDLQTAVPTLSQLAGPYAFSLAGIDTNINPFASAGSFTLNSSGTITTGVQDFNDNGIAVTNRPVTGNITLGSGTAPGTIILSSGFGALIFDFYPIDATHLKFIETDFTEILAGDTFSQTGASIPTGTMVFTMSGGTSSTGPIANGGFITSDGTGNFSAGLEDVNVSGTVPPQLQFTGAAAAGGSIGGRVIVNLSGFVPAIQWVIYPSSGGLLMLETDSASVTAGSAFIQTATSFAATQGYGLNLTGVNPNGEVDNIAQFNASSPTTSPNMKGVLDDNELGIPPTANLPLTGTYTPDSPATGRGFISVPTLGTLNGTLGLQYYVMNGSTTLFVELDSNQVAVGSFGLQNPSSSQALMRPVLAIVRPAKSHPALKRK